MLRYDLNMAGYGIPGLTFMTRYARGWGADYSNANEVYMRQDDNGAPLSGQKRWERDVEARYVVQTGSFKDLPVQIISPLPFTLEPNLFRLDLIVTT